MKRWAVAAALWAVVAIAWAGVPSSGAIRLSDLQDQFGGSNPISLSEYYRGGGLVPNASPWLSVPPSGTIGLANFYVAPVAQLPAGSVTLVGSNPNPDLNGAGIGFATSPTTITVYGANSGSLPGSNWIVTGSPSDFQVNLSQSGGTTWPSIPTEDVPNTWLSMSTPRHWFISAGHPIYCISPNPCPNPWTFTGTLYIRRASDSVVVASMTVSMSSSL